MRFPRYNPIKFNLVGQKIQYAKRYILIFIIL